MKVTIAIPNFNGQELLRKNLPPVLKSGAEEVLVIDDGSKDGSLEILKQEFPDVKLLVNQKNKGFIPSVNKLFKEASGDIVVLLNSDVTVTENFLKPILEHFKNKQIFAVNLHEKGEGPSNAFWKNGFYEFKRGEEKKDVQKSAWASGGSAAFRKEYWQNLGGFDEVFAPFYWEDTDLSFRALKRGFDILWEPKALVEHEHETTISKSFKKRYVRWVQERNQILFIWKNISDPKLKSEHRVNLVKRLLTKPGYWMPFFWAIWRSGKIRKTKDQARNDLEVINYAE